MAQEKKAIEKKGWISSFTLIGKPVINDYTFKIDEHSGKSKWVYNALNLGVNCSEKFGTVYCELIGGYSEEGKNEIYVHGKNEDGFDDYKKKIVIDFEDRFNEDILEEVGERAFLTVGLEKTNENKTFYKKFISAYDAIAYIKEHLTSDMVINVKGDLKYSLFNNTVQVKKVITSIALSKADEPSKYKAVFTQSILIDKDSASLKNIDKNKGTMCVDTRVLDFMKEYNGIKLVNTKGEEKGGQFPYNKQFEFKFPNLEDGNQCKSIYETLFKVKDGVKQIDFEGEFIENGATTTLTWDDVSDDGKWMVSAGFMTKEEAIMQCADNGSREKRMILVRPVMKKVGDEDKKVNVIQQWEDKFTEDDLFLDYLYVNESSDEAPFDVDEESDVNDDMAWLNELK